MNNLLKIGDIKIFGKFNMVGAVYDYDNSSKSYMIIGLNGSICSVPYNVSPIKSVKLSSEIRTKLHDLALMKARIIACEKELDMLRDKSSRLTANLCSLYNMERGR